MKSSHRTRSIHRLLANTAACAAAAGFSLCAHAQQAPEPAQPDYTLGFNVGAVSDYRVRGIAQTSGDPALQGGVDFTHHSGIYLGTFASNVKWVKELNGATKGSYELDLYGGWRGEVLAGLSADVGVITYRYPGNNSGVGGVLPAGTFTKADTTEVYGALTYNIVTFKYNRSTGDFLGNPNSSGSQYFDLSAAVPVGEGLTLTPHVGRQRIPGQAGNAGDYTDVSLALAKDFGKGFAGTIMALHTNANHAFYTDTRGRYLGNSKLLVGLKYSF